MPDTSKVKIEPITEQCSTNQHLNEKIVRNIGEKDTGPHEKTSKKDYESITHHPAHIDHLTRRAFVCQTITIIINIVTTVLLINLTVTVIIPQVKTLSSWIAGRDDLFCLRRHKYLFIILCIIGTIIFGIFRTTARLAARTTFATARLTAATFATAKQGLHYHHKDDNNKNRLRTSFHTCESLLRIYKCFEATHPTIYIKQPGFYRHMGALKTNFNGNPNVGLFGYCTNEYCLLGTEVKEKDAKEVGEALGVPVHRITICGTSLLGVFLAGNSHMLLVPEIAFDYELKKLEELGIKYTVIKTKQTALGNNLLCNDNGCLASTEFSAFTKKRIREALNVSLKPGTIAGLPTVGSLGALNSRKGIVHREIENDEKAYAEELLDIDLEPSTVNMGSPYVRSGLLCNDKGFVVGDMSGGPEIANISQEMGYTEVE